MKKAVRTRPTTKMIVYACSGGSDAGELADRVARRLSRNGVAEMACLAAVHSHKEEAMNRLEGAVQVFVLDGCPESCARNILEQAGCSKLKYVGLHELGVRKDGGPVTEAQVAAATDVAMRLINF